MNITKFMRRENSGLTRTTLEHAKYEALLGHNVVVREPQGKLLWGREADTDIYTIHSQCDVTTYHDGKPKILLCHGEPLSSVGNGMSMRAVVDMASLMECLICMRRGELSIWNLIRKTHYVPKGVDLEVFRPIPGVEKFEGEPSVLYYENIRGSRNPLYIVAAMAQVRQKLPPARLHLINVDDLKMRDTFNVWAKHSKLWTSMV